MGAQTGACRGNSSLNQTWPSSVVGLFGLAKPKAASDVEALEGRKNTFHIMIAHTHTHTHTHTHITDTKFTEQYLPFTMLSVHDIVYSISLFLNATHNALLDVFIFATVTPSSGQATALWARGETNRHLS